MLAASVSSVNITAGIGEIKHHGLTPPPHLLAWSAASAGTVGDFATDIDLTPLVAPAHSSAVYRYRAKFVMRSDEAPLNVGLNGLTLTSMVQVAPLALPALKLGANQVRYSDQS